MLKTLEYGSSKGPAFDKQYPRSIGFRCGSVIDAIILNGNRYGGDGGVSTEIVTLPDSDYWSDFEVHNTGEITYLYLSSHGSTQGKVILQGGNYNTGIHNAKISGSRILRIGGYYDGKNTGHHLNRLEIDYIENYVASQTIEDDASAILDFTPGKQTITEYESVKLRQLESYKKFTELTLQTHWSSAAEGEYYVTFKAQTDLDIKNISRIEIEQAIEKTLEQYTKVEKEISAGETAVAVCRLRILKDAEGNFWAYPKSPISWLLITEKNKTNLVGHFDFTGGIDNQLSLGHQEKYGWRCLTKPISPTPSKHREK